MPRIPARAAAVTTALALWFAPGSPASAQKPIPQVRPPASGAAPRGPAAGPPRKAVPRSQVPRRAPARAPFKLNQQQYEALLAALAAWEQRTSQIDLMSSPLSVIWKDPVFNKQRTLQGEVKYKAPDSGLFRVKDEKGNYTEQWLCDGKSVYEFKYAERKLIEHQIPPNMRGMAIADGPLPFFFGAKADKLLRRYWMRLVTPPDKRESQVWIESYPRYQRDAANFRRATIILNRGTVLPQAIEVYAPNGKERRVYVLSNIQIGRSLLDIFKPDEFQPRIPSGWVKVVNPVSRPRTAAGMKPPR